MVGRPRTFWGDQKSKFAYFLRVLLSAVREPKPFLGGDFSIINAKIDQQCHKVTESISLCTLCSLHGHIWGTIWGTTVWFVCTCHSQWHYHGHFLCHVVAGKIIQLSGRKDSKYYWKQLSLQESVLSLVLSIYIQQVLPNYHWHHYVDSHHKIFLIFIIYFDYF